MAAQPRGYHHGNLRKALRDAALKLVEEIGPGGLTLRAAARMAGVSQTAPYRHFASKRALLAGVAEEGFRLMTAEMRREAAGHRDDPLGRFQALGLAYVNFANHNPSHFRVMFAAELADKSPYPSLQEAAQDAFGLLVEAIIDCQRARIVRSGDPSEMAVAAWSLVHGLSSLLVDRQLVELDARHADQIARDVTQDLLFGLGARQT